MKTKIVAALTALAAFVMSCGGFHHLAITTA